MNLINIKHINKTYKVPDGNDVIALDDVSLDIKENEFVCVVGPSGCGKTTLMNIIAGLETFDDGIVEMNGENIVGPGPDRGVIFQQYALFPWMTVRKNIEYGMKFLRIADEKSPVVDEEEWKKAELEKAEKRLRESKVSDGDQERALTQEEITTALSELSEKLTYPIPTRKLTKQEKTELADKYIEMVNLRGFENSFPKALSGGMKQRVAIARGYAVAPKVLLMDEPFGALDAQTRAQLQEDLLKTWEKERKTCFFITHDVDEAVLLATKVVIMSARPGKIHEIIDITLPYPRTQATKLDEEFIKLKNYIWDTVYKMYLEVRK